MTDSVSAYQNSNMSRSISDWLKDHLHKKPMSSVLIGSNSAIGVGVRNCEDGVQQSLLSEVETHVRVADRQRQSREKVLRRRSSLPDYTWLLSSANERRYEMPATEKLELLDLCGKVKPSECTAVIYNFRRHITEESSSSEIPRLMRKAVLEQLACRAERNANAPNSGNMPKTVLRAFGIMTQSPANTRPSRFHPSGTPPIGTNLRNQQQQRRNSTLPETTLSSCSSSDENNGRVFLVERAFSFPMLRLDRLEELPPL